jgi:CHAT domain-containing protein
LPRLWWCPTGPLTLFPLHAAGRPDIPGGSVIDRVVSSYTPTLRALIEARDPVPADVPASMLVVAVPHAPGQPPLPNVDREVVLLQSLLPEDRRTVLRATDARVATVRDVLPAHRWVHFSCHGSQNLTDPSQGSLLLYDGPLTITDISARRHQGDFAFLSACKTATGGTALPDEAITLAAALHYTGYRHVIATLWSVRDSTAADVTEAIYTDIIQDGALHPDRSARALHEAVGTLRHKHRNNPSVWIPFIHIGP